MSGMSELSVSATSSPIPPSAQGLRRWLVTVSASLDHQPASSLLLSCSLQPLALELTVSPTPGSELCYLVQETEPLPPLLPLPLKLSALPRYSSAASGLYRLAPCLADLVGRQFLASPKYAITIVHAYARAHNLYTDKSILCDPVLQEIFRVPGLRASSLWSRLQPLLHPVSPSSLALSLVLEDFPVSTSSSLQVSRDPQGRLLPPGFPSPTKPGARSLGRTQSLLGLGVRGPGGQGVRGPCGSGGQGVKGGLKKGLHRWGSLDKGVTGRGQQSGRLLAREDQHISSQSSPNQVKRRSLSDATGKSSQPQEVDVKRNAHCDL